MQWELMKLPQISTAENLPPLFNLWYKYISKVEDLLDQIRANFFSKFAAQIVFVPAYIIITSPYIMFGTTSRSRNHFNPWVPCFTGTQQSNNSELCFHLNTSEKHFSSSFVNNLFLKQKQLWDGLVIMPSEKSDPTC